MSDRARRPGGNEDQTPESIDPTGLWRLLFWLIWIAGTVLFLLTWALLMVPGRAGAMDLIFRSSAATLLLGAVLLARWLWKIRNPFPLLASNKLMRTFMLIVWFELIFALYGVIGLGISLALRGL